MKLAKSLKLTIIVTVILLVATIVLLAVNGLKFGLDYHNSVNVIANFKDPESTDIDAARKIFKKAKDLDTVEASSSNNYVGSYLKLSKNDEEKLRTEFAKVDGFQNLTVVKVHKENPSLNSIAYIGPVFVGFIIFANYFIASGIVKSRNKFGLIFSNVVEVAYIVVVGAGVLSAISYFYPISRELLEFWIYLVLLSISLSVINLFRLNLYFKEHPQENFLNELIKVEERYDRSYVVNVLLSSLFIAPFVVISQDPLYFAILGIVMMGLNIYVETYSFIHFFILWQTAINKLPVIKNLKWTRK
jgi:hypothetical protein